MERTKEEYISALKAINPESFNDKVEASQEDDSDEYKHIELKEWDSIALSYDEFIIKDEDKLLKDIEAINSRGIFQGRCCISCHYIL